MRSGTIIFMSIISFEEFKKLDLRVGKVLSAEIVPGSDNLLNLQIDIGDGKRQIIAGIAKFYGPKELVGKSLVVVVNLEPKKMMGIESQGMILCAESKGEPVCLVPLQEVPPGSPVL